MRNFSFYKKVLSPPDPVAFLRNIFTSTPVMFSNDLNQSVICSFTKRVYKIAIKKRLQPKLPNWKLPNE